jgi:hypothetical protein
MAKTLIKSSTNDVGPSTAAFLVDPAPFIYCQIKGKIP